MHLHLDFETKSKIDLRAMGLDRYSRDPSTGVLILSYLIDAQDGFGPSPPRLWLPHREPMPPKLEEMVRDRKVRKIAHNAAFEIAIFNHVLGIPTSPEEWYCTMVMALSLGLPGDLEQLLRDALKTDRKYWKDEDGKRLMRLFSFPSSTATPESHPEEFAKYCDYGLQDTVAEHKAYSIMKRYISNMGRLFDGWCIDQKINARGLPVDMAFIKSAQKIRDTSKKKYKNTLQEKTWLTNPNSTQQMVGWLTERGYPFASIAKNRVKIAIKDFGDKITDEAKEVIQIRLESNKTSLAKFEAIEKFSWRGRLRNTFQYYGAAATGRYAGRIIGQNMPRPWSGVEDHLDRARQMIADGDLEGLEFFFGKPMEVLASSIRSAIAAPPGKKLVVADYASIELVVIAWWTGCRFWTNVVESGKDAYKAFGERWLGKPYEEITKPERTICKPPALGCGYRMGPGRETGVYPDTEKTGLWGYAANMGIEMTKEQCKEAVKIYRALSPEVEQAWYDLENAAMECVATGRPVRAGMIMFDMKPPFLRMRLPSGRFIHYCRPRIEDVELEFENEEGEVVKSWKTGITYERLSQTSKKWVRRANHGGRYAEQATQGIALDLLQNGIEQVEKAGDFEIVGHYHDEILALIDEDSPLDETDLIEQMVRLQPWAQGMAVRAAGYTGTFYKKD